MFKFLFGFGFFIFICGFATPDHLAFAQENFDASAATEAYIASIPEETREASNAYYEGGYWLTLWNALETVLVSFILLHFGFSKKMRDFGQKLTRFKFVHTYAYMALYLIAIFAFALPLNIYEDYFRKHDYGLTTQSFGSWFSEQFIELGVTVVLFGLAFSVLYKLIAWKLKTWWMWGAVGTVAFIAFFAAISPVFIEPLFNDYQTLEEGEVRDEVLSLARANQVPADEIYVFNSSNQTTGFSANVSGMFGTTRIAMNDNVLNQGSLGEIRATVAHEMGHSVNNLFIALIIPWGLVALVGFAIIHKSFNRINTKFGKRWGVKDIADPAGLPLLFAIFAIYLLLMTPVLNTITRESERSADLYGLNAAREPDAMAQLAVRFGTSIKVDPSPLEEIIFYDHPAPKTRIQMAMEWKAENLEETP